MTCNISENKYLPHESRIAKCDGPLESTSELDPREHDYPMKWQKYDNVQNGDAGGKEGKCRVSKRAVIWSWTAVHKLSIHWRRSLWNGCVSAHFLSTDTYADCCEHLFSGALFSNPSRLWPTIPGSCQMPKCQWCHIRSFGLNRHDTVITDDCPSG